MIDFQRLNKGQSILTLGGIALLFFFSIAQAKSNDPNTRIYAQSLNSSAVLVMDWYEHLIDAPKNSNAQFSQKLWNTQRSVYPDNIQGITLVDAQMTTLGEENGSSENRLQFSTTVILQYLKNNELYEKTIQDTFYFNSITPVTIARVTHQDNNNISSVSNGHQQYDKAYYQSRKLAYAWLSHMNGVAQAGRIINLPSWQASANYQLTIGGMKASDIMLMILPKQRELLGEGRYLLRKINDKPLEENRREMTLTIDFKGVKDGTPIVAHIEQVIEYQILNNGNWEVTSIKERHLLPNPQPWQKILC